MNDEAKKPSERINKRIPELREALFDSVLSAAGNIVGYKPTPEEWAEFKTSGEGRVCLERCETAAALAAIVEYLDAEHARRQEFERSVLERLRRLELPAEMRCSLLMGEKRQA